MLPVLLLLILFPDPTIHVVAQAATDAGPWLTGLNIGLAAIGLWAFTTGRIHSDKELQRTISRCDEEFKRVAGKLDAAEAELRAQNREWRETLGPTLTRVALLLAESVDHTPPPKGRQRP